MIKLRCSVKTTTSASAAVTSLFWVALLRWGLLYLEVASGKGLVRLGKVGCGVSFDFT